MSTRLFKAILSGVTPALPIPTKLGGRKITTILRSQNGTIGLWRLENDGR